MKSLKPIRSESDYDRALAEVEELWGAKAGTPKGDRLDILATLIGAYEDRALSDGFTGPERGDNSRAEDRLTSGAQCKFSAVRYSSALAGALLDAFGTTLTPQFNSLTYVPEGSF